MLKDTMPCCHLRKYTICSVRLGGNKDRPDAASGGSSIATAGEHTSSMIDHD